MHRLVNAVKPYAWGSRTSIAELRGLPSPSAGPEAELWMGAHPSAPSRVVVEGQEQSLDACILQSPETELGHESLGAFGPKLPFLLKVLAAAAPLSLQAHPTQAQARAGFAAENALGLALDAPTRSYKDDNHKPEVLCALSPFWALSGFRRPAQIAELFRALDVPGLMPFVHVLEGDLVDPAKLRSVFLGLFRHAAPGDLARSVVASAVGQRAQLALGGFGAESEWTERLGRDYPGDVGVVVALLLNLVRLSPGQALFLDAGNLHAYLEGTGIELMASSDNVLRGGLTVKHIDVNGLAEVLDFTPNGVPRASRVATPSGAIEYRTSAREFLLTRIDVHGACAASTRPGPQILLVTRGSVRANRGADSMTIERGDSVYLAHSDEALVLEGEGTVFRASTGLELR